jgi:hypothetical protein
MQLFWRHQQTRVETHRLISRYYGMSKAAARGSSSGKTSTKSFKISTVSTSKLKMRL